MDGFRKEVDREFEDQRKQNQHHVEFYLQAGVKPGAHIRLPTYKHPKVYKDWYKEHGYAYGYPGYPHGHGYGYPPYAGPYANGAFPWGHPNYGVPYVPRSKSPQQSELDASRSYKYAPSKVYDLDLEAKQDESADLTAEEEAREKAESPREADSPIEPSVDSKRPQTAKNLTPHYYLHPDVAAHPYRYMKPVSPKKRVSKLATQPWERYTDPVIEERRNTAMSKRARASAYSKAIRDVNKGGRAEQITVDL